MRAKQSLLFAAVLFFPACTGYYQGQPLLTGEEVGVLSAGIAQTQFSDLPIPASFELQTGDLESFGTQVGGFRLGHLIYHGEATPAEAASYLISRLPEHGWKQTSRMDGESGAASLVFEKGPQTATFAISREAGSISSRQQTGGSTAFFTKLLIDIKTGKGHPTNGSPANG